MLRSPLDRARSVLNCRATGSGAGHCDPAVWVFSISGFHRFFATKPVRSETSKQYGGVGDGIRVNSIHPGFIDTPLTQGQDPAINAIVIGLTPMKRAGTPLEIANGCLFLASDESSFMTGAELVIDGGYLAQ